MAQSLSMLLKIEDKASALVTNKGGKSQVRMLRDYLNAVLSGAKNANLDVFSSASAPVAASGTATLVSCATDTITIGGITFTGSGSPTGDNQFETDGNDAADAAALTAKINAHPTLSKVVVASALSNVVTITCLQKGVVGNFITLAETGSTITLSGAALAGGTGGAEGAAQNYSVGL